jgi:NAD(P)-dependent dehydrogenase (short-subunit alcohol dehydrogenase family)
MSVPRAGRAVVTGAASGFGREVCLQLAARGWQIAAVDLAAAVPAAWGALGESVIHRGGGWLPCPFDVREAAGWHGLATLLEARWSALDLLVNAAGVGATGEVGRLPLDQWRRVIDTNLLGTAIGCETLLPLLRRNPRPGRLLNVASIAGILAPPSMAAYAASKAGVIALSEAIAAECRGRPTVTVTCPGFFQSGLLGSWHFSADREQREARRRMAVTPWTSATVAEQVLAATFAGRRYAVLGRQARWLWRLKRLAPAVTTGLISRVYHRLERSD